MPIREFIALESAPSYELNNDASQFCVGDDSICFDYRFFAQLRHEMLRAQRSKTSLSIILLTPEKNNEIDSINIIDILKLIQAQTRDTDTVGFADHKTIGILLPDTDEQGANEICGKLVFKNKMQEFITNISTYPDHIFESLAKNASIQPNVFPFELFDSTRTSWFKLLLKRGGDVVGSIIGILIFLPVMFVTALAIKTTSPGPIIFSQIRLGKQGKSFTFYKFRSMHVNMDDQIHREYIKYFINGHHGKVNQGHKEEPLFKIKADPRITRVGRFIRKTSIDELPQFFNVLKGDMSLVGPRPPLSYEAEKYQAWHLRRILEMKPGITGLWQVEGRSKTTWDDTVRLDIRYIKNWSLLFDLKILLKTVKEVLRCRGAL